MSKLKATVLIFDILLGLLLLFMEIRTNPEDEMHGSGLKTVSGVEVTGISETDKATDNKNTLNEDDGDGEEIKKIALTFDDEVIIGLSQEISYKEAVSMI